MRFYRPKWFTIDELVPSALLKKNGEERCWLLLDPRLTWTLDQIREHYGVPVWVNVKGNDQRGFRTKVNPKTPASQHYYGRAADLTIERVTPARFHKNVHDGKLDTELTYITRVEAVTTHIHIDCAPIPGTQIVFFKP